MSTIEILPLILLAVVIVTSLAEKLRIPYPLLLVIAGLSIGFIPGVPSWRPPDDMVLEIFLPPILFAAARNIAWQEIIENLRTIAFFSVALVFIATILLAAIINITIPVMSFSTAMVLAAIISPTDTVAAIATLSKMKVKQKIINTIELESLFNDATGIVLFNAAILFVSQGDFNLTHISIHTLQVGVIGALIGLLFSHLTFLVIDNFLSDANSQLPIIMSLILAYSSYFFAEHLHASGVLAVVAAGLYYRRARHKIGALTRLTETAVWETLIFLLNGIIFIIIGIQFPDMLYKVDYMPAEQLISYSLITIVTLLALRLIWVTIVYSAPVIISDKKFSPPWKEIILITWSGMRGLVSLALALAIPMKLYNQVDFPNRDIIEFLTITTILFTLLVQGLSLPLLIKKLKFNIDSKLETQKIIDIYHKITKHAVKNMNKIIEDKDNMNKQAKELVVHYYDNRLLNFNMRYESEAESNAIAKDAQYLLGKILQHEREILIKLRKNGSISEDIYQGIMNKLDRDEVGFASYK